MSFTNKYTSPPKPRRRADRVRNQSKTCTAALLTVMIVSVSALWCVGGLTRAQVQEAGGKASSAGTQWNLAETRMHYKRAVRKQEPYGPVFASFGDLANQGSSEAKAWLGACFLFGHGTNRDVARGTSLIRQSADVDDPVGLRMLARLEANGTLVARDSADAIRLYQKAIARGDAPSYDQLAMLYLFGDGTSKDPAKAMALLRAGADLGDPAAQVHLAEMYERGDLQTQVPRNHVLAASLYEKASAEDNLWAMYRLGKMLVTGEGVPINRQRGLDLLTTAAVSGIIPARAELGAALADDGSVASEIRAYAWSYLASQRGNKQGLETIIGLSSKLTAEQVNEAKVLATKYSSEDREASANSAQ